MAINLLTIGHSAELADLAQRLSAGVARIQVDGRGIGTGILWQVGPTGADGQADGTVITNAHVVGAIRAPAVTLRLADGREVRARVTAVDPARDLAALHVCTDGLSALEIGDSTALRVGEIVLAIGNPFGRFNALTVGVVAACAPVDPALAVEPAETPNRDGAPSDGARDLWLGWRQPRTEVIQADIRLYPGNSGGPLLDARGRVVGVNAMVGGGLAFAVPSASVRQFLSEVQRANTRPHLGVTVASVPLPSDLRQRHGLTQRGAALVLAVEPASAADAAGLFVGDVLLAIDGGMIAAAELLPGVLARVDESRGVSTASLLRGGALLERQLAFGVRAAA